MSPPPRTDGVGVAVPADSSLRNSLTSYAGLSSPSWVLDLLSAATSEAHLIAQMLGPVWGWFKQAAEIVGEQPMDIRMQWTPARRELIDPQKEVGAIIEAVRGGLMSLSEAIRRSGYEPGEVMREIATDAQMLDELGLILDTDPRKITAAGMVQAVAQPNNTEEDSEDG